MMLMITVEADRARVTLRLEGQLSGAQVRELSKTCDRAAVARPPRALSIDVTGVESIDRRGKEFLAEVHRRGSRLVGYGATRAIVDEIIGTGTAPGSVRT
jgi:anti-anti-sigma regulatory factor